MEDVEIVRRVKNGDTDALAVLVEKYHERRYGSLFGVSGTVRRLDSGPDTPET